MQDLVGGELSIIKPSLLTGEDLRPAPLIAYTVEYTVVPAKQRGEKYTQTFVLSGLCYNITNLFQSVDLVEM